MPPPPARSLPEEMVEEILLRFPPDDPARLVHAALVCKPWCAIISGAGFRRRFREFHRTPPLLGFLSGIGIQGAGILARFFPTCSLPVSRVHSRRGRHVCVADAHHGRVLLYIVSFAEHRWSFAEHRWFAEHRGSDVLMVLDPTTDQQEEVPVPPEAQWQCIDWAAAVLCAASGPCDHLDCGRGPFLIVFVGNDFTHSETVLCTYSSSTASWSKPISSNQLPFDDKINDCNFTQPAHVHSAIYFGVLTTDHILKFDWESQEISWIRLPTAFSREQQQRYVLTTTESGGLGVAAIHESSKLYMWSRHEVSQVDATWTQSRVIDLKTLLPDHAVLASPEVLAFTIGAGVIFVKSNNNVLFVIDLKTYKVIKEVSEARKIDNNVLLQYSG